METKRPRPTPLSFTCACLFIATLAPCAPVFAASAPTPLIETSRMSYQLENQSFNLLASLPLENHSPTLNSGAANPDYAVFTSFTWGVSTNSGKTWRKIGTVPEDAGIYPYTSGTEYYLGIATLKTSMTGWQYRVTTGISCYNGQPDVTRTSAPVTLDVKPSFMNYPVSLALDDTGNLYVADLFANAIWKITGDSKISLFAGSATGEAGAINATGVNARFSGPRGIAYYDGKLYVADSGNNAIRVITSGGAVTTHAGALGSPGDYQEGASSDVRFNLPAVLTVDTSGNVYVADYNNFVIRKITPDGSTSHVAGEYAPANNGGSASGTMIIHTGSGGTVLNGGTGGVIMVGNWHSGVTGTLSPIGVTGSSGGIILDLNDSPISTGTTPEAQSSETPHRFYGLSGITISSDNKTLYIADVFNNDIVAVAIATGTVTPLGLDYIDSVPNDPRPFSAPMIWPYGLRCDKSGNLYVVDAGYSRIIKTTPSGSAQTIAGINNWYYDENTERAYTYYANSFEDGKADTALFNCPTDIALAPDGSIYVADSENAAIRKITFNGATATVSTLLLTEAPPASNNPETGNPGNSANDGSSGGGGGAPSAWYLFALAVLTTLAAPRPRRR